MIAKPYVRFTAVLDVFKSEFGQGAQKNRYKFG
jgi:hypothetical protein